MSTDKCLWKKYWNKKKPFHIFCKSARPREAQWCNLDSRATAAAGRKNRRKRESSREEVLIFPGGQLTSRSCCSDRWWTSSKTSTRTRSLDSRGKIKVTQTLFRSVVTRCVDNSDTCNKTTLLQQKWMRCGAISVKIPHVTRMKGQRSVCSKCDLLPKQHLSLVCCCKAAKGTTDTNNGINTSYATRVIITILNIKHRKPLHLNASLWNSALKTKKNKK